MDFKQLSNRICTISGSFVDLRKFNYIYVDKTREIYDLASQRDFFFQDLVDLAKVPLYLL